MFLITKQGAFMFYVLFKIQTETLKQTLPEHLLTPNGVSKSQAVGI
jgi:hypothetical protein